MTLTVYTSMVYGPHQQDKDFLDISVKTGSPIFAPTWNMVARFKSGDISPEEYTREYLNLMRTSWKEHSDAWQVLLSKNRIILACYCKPHQFCHRRILATILTRCGAKYKGEI